MGSSTIFHVEEGVWHLSFTATDTNHHKPPCLELCPQSPWPPSPWITANRLRRSESDISSTLPNIRLGILPGTRETRLWLSYRPTPHNQRINQLRIICFI